MTKTYWPFDAGAGSSAQEDLHSYMHRWYMLDGVIRGYLNSLEVIGDSTGMQVKIKSGMGIVHGHWLRSDAQDTYAIAAADGTNPRIDRAVLYVDWVNNLVGIKIVTGTAAATPSPPALVTSDLVEWQKRLALINVAAGASTIAPADVLDDRDFAVPQLSGIPRARVTRTTDQSIANNTLVPLSWDSETYDTDTLWLSSAPTRLTIHTAGVYDIKAAATFTANATGRRVLIARINGSSDIGSVNVPSAGSAADDYTMNLLVPDYALAAGDYVEIYALQQSGGALNVRSTGGLPACSIRMAAA